GHYTCRRRRARTSAALGRCLARPRSRLELLRGDAISKTILEKHGVGRPRSAPVRSAAWAPTLAPRRRRRRTIRRSGRDSRAEHRLQVKTLPAPYRAADRPWVAAGSL